jgi:hypothetical protein
MGSASFNERCDLEVKRLEAGLATLTRERDEARAERDMFREECASISAEFGLPPTIRPAEGEICRMRETASECLTLRTEVTALRAALRGAVVCPEGRRGDVACLLCGGAWFSTDPAESHAPGCLATEVARG